MLYRFFICGLLWWMPLSQLDGSDYFLTIAGGYAPQGNQASLEANVLFYQGLIVGSNPGQPNHKIYFADGEDDKHDLQFVAPRAAPKSPAFALLRSAFDLDRPRIEYRNHRVNDISGPISPSEIREGFDWLQNQLTDGDRLIIYVTAHGSAAKGKDKMDTSIACWNRKELTMKSFSKWLDELPSSVPVVLVMAQCYCGGFVNTMFEEGDSTKPLSSRSRVGFFAQRHDLPAAGCRPDIENDEEYSSYFWGAFRGQLRSGGLVESSDFNRDGRVSFSEAHAFAVMASPTIDIPLKTSDEFLRRFSRINEYTTLPLGENVDESPSKSVDGLCHLSGTISEVAKGTTSEGQACILALANQLAMAPDTDVSELFTHLKSLESELQQARPARGRGGPRGGRSSRRRDFRDEIISKWPELKDPSEWDSISWLQPDECDHFLTQVQGLSNYEPFQKSIAERTQARERATALELKQVRLRRLLYTVETAVLEKNFPLVADDEMKAKYAALRSLENTTLR